MNFVSTSIDQLVVSLNRRQCLSFQQDFGQQEVFDEVFLRVILGYFLNSVSVCQKRLF